MSDNQQYVSSSTPPSDAASDPVTLAPTVGLPPQPPKKSKKRWLVPVVIAVLAVLLVAALVYAVYLPGTPKVVYNASLTNSGRALDKIISYAQDQQKLGYKSTTIDSNVKVKSASGSFDLGVHGAADKNANADLMLNADVMGQKLTGNIRSLHTGGNETPDIYVQVQGDKKLFDSYGLGSVNNQWISIDHTLIDTFASKLKAESDSKTETAATVPSYDQVMDAITKVQTVNKERLFTTDKNKAVLANEKFMGSETQNGRPVNHYKVGYNKSHLQAYVAALKTALDTSKLNDWSKKVNGKNVSEVMDFDSLEKSVKDAKSDYTFDLWADTRTKLVSKLDFTDLKDQSHMTLSQNYTSGSQYPFSLRTTGKDENGNPEDTTLQMTLDAKTHKVSVKADDTVKESDSTTTTHMDVTFAPSDKSLQVSAPKGAKPINDLLRQFGLGGLIEGQGQNMAGMPSFTL